MRKDAMSGINPRTDAQPTTRDLTQPTTGHLIAGGKVQGTWVYSMEGEHIGSIEDVMLDKATGKVAYAVLSFGGFLGIGSKHYPLPWEMLRYDTRLGGYVVKLDKARLENAPVIEEGWHDRRRAVDDYWAMPMA
jgi:hypothetical protein